MPLQSNDGVKIKSKDSVETFIGVQLISKINGIVIHQTKHISDNLQKFNLNDVLRTYVTPIELDSSETTNKYKLLDTADIKLYQSIIGVLNYLCQCSRPDISYAVCVLAQKAKSPNENDLRRAKRVLLYLKRNCNYGIKFIISDNSNIRLDIYVDSSFANGVNRKSINGYIIFINGNLVHWKTRVSSMVCQSSTEAEFVAVAIAMKDVEWIFNIILELQQKISVACVFVDNQAAIKIFKSHVSTARTKHMDYRLQYVKELFKTRYELRYVRSEDNIADVFTKGLGKNNFYKCMNKFMVKL